MRQLVFLEAGVVAWQDASEPRLCDSGSALVRPLAVARCDLDHAMAAFGFFPGPFPVGHETVAEVIAVGDEVSERRVGERVLVPFQVSCGTCVACRDGRFGACHTYRARAGAAFGFGQAGGGHGGAAASIGLYAVAFARAMGSARVRYVDRDEERCAIGAVLGAEVEHQEGPWPRRYDRAPITVEASGELDGLNAVLRSTDDYGFCTAVAIHFAPTVGLPLLEMYTRGITFHLSRADSRRLLPVVIEMFATGRFDPLVVPTTIVPWDRADDAWLEPATKLVLERE